MRWTCCAWTGDGNLAVVELKRGRTPRDVISQALEYSSWVKELDFDEINRHRRFLSGDCRHPGDGLPGEARVGAVIVAESVDSSTDGIVKYLAEMEAPINVATVQHFEDASARELLAQAYLIEPESVQPRARRMSARSGYRTVKGL